MFMEKDAFGSDDDDDYNSKSSRHASRRQESKNEDGDFSSPKSNLGSAGNLVSTENRQRTLLQQRQMALKKQQSRRAAGSAPAQSNRAFMGASRPVSTTRKGMGMKQFSAPKAIDPLEGEDSGSTRSPLRQTGYANNFRGGFKNSTMNNSSYGGVYDSPRSSVDSDSRNDFESKKQPPNEIPKSSPKPQEYAESKTSQPRESRGREPPRNDGDNFDGPPVIAAPRPDMSNYNNAPSAKERPQQYQQPYQQGPPGGYQQGPPGGYQQPPPNGWTPQSPYGGPGFQGPPGGYYQGPPGGYYQGPPGGYYQGPPGGYYQGPPQGAPGYGAPGYQPDPNASPAGKHQPPQSDVQEMVRERNAKRAEDEKKKADAEVKVSEKRMKDRGLTSTYDPAPVADVVAESKTKDENLEMLASMPAKKLDLSDMRAFLTTAVTKDQGIVQCYIERNKGGTKKMFPEYHLFMKDGDKFLLAAKKRAKNRTSNYSISMDRHDLSHTGHSFLGKLRANFIGTEFQIFDNGSNPKNSDPDSLNVDGTQVRQELGAVLYASNVLGSRGPRKMKVAVPEVKPDNTRVIWRPIKKSEEILTRFKDRDLSSLVKLINKPPRWNEQVGAYVLNFNGRVTMASVKNFQLVTPEDQDAVVLQFGRVGKDLFTCDVAWPLSPMQAFAICLSSFDSKLACE